MVKVKSPEGIAKRIVMVSAQEIGQKACDLVTEYEKRQGRKVEKASQGSGYDLISTKGRDVRKIEVKAEKGSQLMDTHAYALTPKEWQIFSSDKDKDAWLYIVYSINNNPKLVRLQRNQIFPHQIKTIPAKINIRFKNNDKERLKENTEALS